MTHFYKLKRKTGSDLLADFATNLFDLTRGDSVSITFRFPGGRDLDDLTVSGTYTVTSGSSEIYGTITVPSGATLVVESGATLICNTLDNDGTVTNNGDLLQTNAELGSAGWVELQQAADFGGQYRINETLDSTQTYAETLPAGADVDSLVLGIEPSGDLQANDVTGIWGIVDGGTDERNPTLNEYQYTIDLTVLAELSEYSDVTALEADLKTN